MHHITVEQFNRLTKPKKQSKYRNRKVERNGLKFDSQGEGDRWAVLQLLESAGQIQELRRQVWFRFTINGINCGAYVADFVYTENGHQVVEDYKSPHTRKLPMYRLKKKLMRACFGIEIREVTK